MVNRITKAFHAIWRSLKQERTHAMSSIIQRLQGAFGEPSGVLPNVLIPRPSSRRINPAPSNRGLDPAGRITLNPFILGRCGINRKTKRMTVGVTIATLILSLVVSGGFFTPMAQAAAEVGRAGG